MLMSHAGCQTRRTATAAQGPRSSIHITHGLAVTASPARSGYITPSESGGHAVDGATWQELQRHEDENRILCCKAQNHGSLQLRTTMVFTEVTGQKPHLMVAAEAPPPARITVSAHFNNTTG